MNLIRFKKVQQKVGTGRSTTYSQISEGLLPKPVSIGSRAVAWPEHEIDSIIKARVAGKSDDEIRDLVRKLEAARKEAA